jgi:hypothetical protein
MAQSTTTPTDPTDEYTSSDLGQSAFVLTCEWPLLRVDHDGPRAVFVFPGPARDVARLFFMPGRNLVDARKFHLNLRELRGLARGGGRFQ